MSTDMRAVVLDALGPPEPLVIQRIPIPTPVLGEVLIEVKAFGLNRSELHTRLGIADATELMVSIVPSPWTSSLVIAADSVISASANRIY